MTEPDIQRPRKRVPRRHLLDRASQLSMTRYIAGAIVGMGLLYAFALFVFIGSDLFVTSSVQTQRLVLLAVHAAYFLAGGALLIGLVILLTHRFAGPAKVMSDAVESMRNGDYDARLHLRRHDYHKRLASKLALLQQDLAERDRQHESTVQAIRQAVATDDLDVLRRFATDEAGDAVDASDVKPEPSAASV